MTRVETFVVPNTTPNLAAASANAESSTAPLADANPTAVPDGDSGEQNETGAIAEAIDDDGDDVGADPGAGTRAPPPEAKKKESPGCLTLLVGASTVGLLIALVTTGFVRCGTELMTVNASDDEVVDCSNAVDFSTNVFGAGRAGAVSFNGGASALYIEGMTVTNDRCFVGSHEVTASDLEKCAGVMMALTPDASGFTPFVEIDGRTVTCDVGSGEVKDCFPKQ